MEGGSGLLKCFSYVSKWDFKSSISSLSGIFDHRLLTEESLLEAIHERGCSCFSLQRRNKLNVCILTAVMCCTVTDGLSQTKSILKKLWHSRSSNMRIFILNPFTSFTSSRYVFTFATFHSIDILQCNWVEKEISLQRRWTEIPFIL